MPDNALVSLFKNLESFGDKPALFGNGFSPLSFRSLIAHINDLSATLKEAFPANTRIITLLNNHATTPLYLLGICQEHIAAPLNPGSTIDEIEQAIKGQNTVAILADEDSITEDLKKLAESNKIALITAAYKDFDCQIETIFQYQSQNQDIIPKDTCLILQTSGSTGHPKRVPITRQAMAYSAQTIGDSLALTNQDRVVHMLPMFHIGAILDLLIVPLSRGGQVHIASEISIQALLNSLHQSQATWFQAVPTILKALLQSCTEDELKTIGKHLRFVRSVSADLAPAIQEELEQQLGNTPIVQMYGMTETCGQIASNPIKIENRKLGSVGQINGAETYILDRFGNPVSIEKEGEICVKGVTVTAGYENTNMSDHLYGTWLRTGDMGYIDEDGFLFLTGRIKDMINRGGEKISTLEIDQCLYELPDILQAAVYPVTHPTLGEDTGVSVVLDQNSKLTQDQIIEHLTGKLSPHKIPRKVHFLETLPKLGSGKIDKQSLRNSHNLIATNMQKTVPQSKLGKELSNIWAETLNTQPPTKSDDFFDAGGDSLLAQNFIFKLEDLMKTTLPANLLFEAPTFGALEESLHTIRQENYQSPLPENVFKAIKNITSSWKGARRHATSLIIERNGIGTKTPVFFCAADDDNFMDIEKQLGSERPFYAMRSLSKLPEETLENMKFLCQHYADEVSEIYANGPLIITGYCKGAVIAKLLIDELARRGRATDLFVVLDRVLKESHQGPVLNAWSVPSFESVRAKFLHPEMGLNKLFPNQQTTHFDIPIEHKSCTTGEGAKLIAQTMEEALTKYDQGLPIATPEIDLANHLKDRKNLYHAELLLKAPRFAKAGEQISINVTAKNTSQEIWETSPKSGLRLLAQWERPLNSYRPSNEVAGFCDLYEDVKPGEKIQLLFTLPYPESRSPLSLKVDMVDEGVAWFSDANPDQQPKRRLILRKFW